MVEAHVEGAAVGHNLVAAAEVAEGRAGIAGRQQPVVTARRAVRLRGVGHAVGAHPEYLDEARALAAVARQRAAAPVEHLAVAVVGAECGLGDRQHHLGRQYLLAVGITEQQQVAIVAARLELAVAVEGDRDC